MTTYYVDGVSGNDGNAGTSFGAAWQTLSKLFTTIANGDTGVICATTTYTLTSTVTATVVGTAASGGVTIVGGDSSGNILTASGTPPTITSATNSVALISLNAAAFWRFKFLKLTHTAATRGDGFACVTSAPSNIFLEGVTIDGCLNGWNGGGRDATNSLMFSDCAILNCTASGIVNAVGAGGASLGVLIKDSLIYNPTSHGYSSNGGTTNVTAVRSVFANCGGNGLYDTGTTRTSVFNLVECALAENTSNGIRSDATTGSGGSFALFGSNNVIWGNGSNGVNVVNQAATNTDCRSGFRNNFYGNNGTNLTGISAGAGDVTGVNDPFVSKGSGKNWALNGVAGAGALIRAAGYPGTYRGSSTNNYLDGGAAQHQDLVAPTYRAGM